MAPRDRDVRVGVVLTTAHLVWWLLAIGIAVWGAAHGPAPSWGWATRLVTTIEPALYAIGMTVLAARWFWRCRGDSPMQTAA